jgi:phytoene dehydrogenase-like protein
MARNQMWHYDVAVIGGGIAGLTAATFVARSGKSVIVFEQAEHIGGRGVTQNIQGFHFNLGPHALYRAGHAVRVLKELGIIIPDGKVGTAGSKVVHNDRLYRFPAATLSLLSTRLFSITARLEAASVLTKLTRIETHSLDTTTVREWIDAEVKNPVVKDFIEALIRVSTYCNDAQHLSAGAALQQLQTAFQGGVSYLSGGWQTLIDPLHTAAFDAGAFVATDAHVQALEFELESGEARRLRLSDGTPVSAGCFIVAVPPATAARLLDLAAGTRLGRSIQDTIPIQAACLDFGLRRLPHQQTTFALGLDRPMYFSVHSRWARLGPEHTMVVHAAKYLPCGIETDASQDRREIEAYLNLVQPGWDREVLVQRFLPKMTVTHAVPMASTGGLAGRPAVDALAMRNVYLAGDWVGSEGMLADASFASAQRAARLAVQRDPIEKSLEACYESK